MRTGYDPEFFSINLEQGVTYKILIGSDGVWDVIVENNVEDISRFALMTADEALAFVKGRWLQEWNMGENEDSTEFYKGKYETWQCDDISLVMVDIIPN